MIDSCGAGLKPVAGAQQAGQSGPIAQAKAAALFSAKVWIFGIARLSQPDRTDEEECRSTPCRLITDVPSIANFASGMASGPYSS